MDREKSPRESKREPGPVLGELTASLEYIPPPLQNVEIFKSEEHLYPPVAEQVRRESTVDRRLSRKKSDQIDRQIKEDAKKLDPENHIWMLLLGPGDAGKTTILKQMKILHGGGFTQQDREQALLDIHSSIVRNTRYLIYELDKDEKQSELDLIRQELTQHQDGSRLSHSLGSTISILYKEKLAPFIENLSMEDTAYQFLQNADKFTGDYLPSDDDILRCRKKTEHIADTVFQIEDKMWHMVDVAGQVDKRSRWATYFDKNVNAFIYVLSAASFCQSMEEDKSTNRLVDAIGLFTSLIKNPAFKVNSCVLFFNKIDLLEERLSKHKIADYVPRYEGDNTKQAYLKWLAKIFTEMASERKLSLYTFNTNATDKLLMKKVVSSVRYPRSQERDDAEKEPHNAVERVNGFKLSVK
ncbi:guanine nucleotide binding protein, alpha subunit [Gorgonomyces haynaldii]|nr:guanine nucleotide binding protein, alpha subunit [Gorgonomyces haynaldii]